LPFSSLPVIKILRNNEMGAQKPKTHQLCQISPNGLKNGGMGMNLF
jgi:hypothetical protein